MKSKKLKLAVATALSHSSNVELLEVRRLFSVPVLVDPVITSGGIVDPQTGAVVYPDAEPADPYGSPSFTGTTSATQPLSSVPSLDSLPAATDKLYLDFTGAAAMTWGGYNVPATPAYDVDGDATTFSAQELTNIFQIWSQVAEAYSPFKIDVTTVNPDPVNSTNYPHRQDMRMVIGGNNSWVGQNVGGISYIGSFNLAYLPNISFVFPSALSSNNDYIAEATIHEAGHEFGLYHQSTYSGTTLTSEYNYGNSTIGPIMGCSYYSTRGLWFDGQNDQSSTTIQDDMSVISNSSNGFGYRTEPSDISIATAAALAVSGTSVSASGVIEHTTDSDVYSFTTGTGAVSLSVNVAQYGAMLHAQAVLKNSSGTVIASADDPNNLGQTISTTLNAGTYYLFVDSYGQYGDVGQYTVSGTVAAAQSTPTFAISGSSSVNEQSAYTLSLSSTDPGHTVSDWVINWGDGNSQTVSGNPSSITHAYADGPNNYTISATATDDTGTYTAGNTIAVAVAHVTPTLILSGSTSTNEGSSYLLGLLALDSGHTVSSWSIHWGDGTTSAVSGDPPNVTHTYSAGPKTYTITATATDDVNTYSAGNSIVVAVAHVPPTLTLSGGSSVNERSSYTLGLSSSDPNHTISSWLITWGDGSTSTVSGNPSSTSHTYAAGPHSYTITATATDDVGTYSAGNSIAVSVAHVAPTLTLSGASTVNERSTYTLGISSSDPNHTISSWLITWGDGSTSTVSGNPSSISHTYAAGPHSYTISATATDDVSTYPAGNTVAVAVAHVTPTLTLTGLSTATERSSYTLGLSSSDPNHTISSWLITWGDGSTSNVTGNPSSASHTYAVGPNTYTITATATDDVSTYAAADNLVVSVAHAAPTLTLSGASSVAEGSAYTLNLAASDPGHTISGWLVSWGDGSTSSLTGNPSSVIHTYAEGPNSYSISATATDDVGNYAAGNNLSVNVTHVTPTLTLSGVSTVNEGSSYTLGLSASDPAHTIGNWTVNWGDGNTQTITGNPSSVTHVFATGPHSYTISATATDDVSTYPAGNSVMVAVAHVAPTLTLSGAVSVNEGSAYTLGLLGVDPGHVISGWLVNWGDGSTTPVTGNPSSISHTYSSGPNTYTISATATDDVSTFAAANSLVISVVHVAPIALLAGDSLVPNGSPYTLGLSAVDPGHTISSWLISWGDGSTTHVNGTPSSVTHTYAGPATEVITATATDDVGTYSAANSLTVAVGRIAPTLTLSGAASIDEGSPYSLALLAIDPGQTITNWTITWGDGSTADVAGNPSSISHTYSTGPSSYVITATATDALGTYTSGNAIPVTVNHVPPVLTVSGAPTVVGGNSYTLGLLAADPGHTISGWSVNWGDGNIQTIIGNPSSVTHVYAVGAGDYTISAAASDEVGTYAAANSINLTVSQPIEHALTITGSKPVLSSSGAVFSLTFTDPAGIDLATAEQSAVSVSGPIAYQQAATVLSTSTISATTVTVEYGVTAPAAKWSWNNNGTYTISATPPAAEVSSGLPVAQISGTFSVNQPAIDGAGNTLKNARNLGRVAPGFSQTLVDTVGPFDTTDYYRLQSTRSQGLSYNVSGLIDGVVVQLLNSAGKVLATQTVGAGQIANSANLIGAGTYYIKVAAAGTHGTDYQLSYSTVVPPVNHAGSTLALARNLGTLTSKSDITLSDSVNPFDTVDMYKLTAAKGSSFNLQLTGLVDDVSAEILNSNGTEISTLQPNAQVMVLDSTPLAPGLYYLKIASVDDAWANYTLHEFGNALTKSLVSKPGVFSNRKIA